MSRSVIIAPRARLDMQEIYDYVAVRNHSAALLLQQDFRDAFALLSKHPNIGHTRFDITQKGLRFWSVQRYMVIYRNSRDIIEIVRVLSAYRDIAALL